MKIAIVGTAPSSRLLAPFADPTWTIWATSPPCMDLPRVDAWFELHSIANLLETTPTGFHEHLCKHPCVYMQAAYPQFPNAKVFPKDELVAEFGLDHFASSASWMCAYAISQKPKEIGFWGIDMAHDSEYAAQRPGCQHFIRVARERGIRVFVPQQSDLEVRMPLYGYSESSPMGAKLRARHNEMSARLTGVNNRIAAIDAEKGTLVAEHHFLTGVLSDLNYQIRTWT